jgi:hypothetical protein
MAIANLGPHFVKNLRPETLTMSLTSQLQKLTGNMYRHPVSLSESGSGDGGMKCGLKQVKFFAETGSFQLAFQPRLEGRGDIRVRL